MRRFEAVRVTRARVATRTMIQTSNHEASFIVLKPTSFVATTTACLCQHHQFLFRSTQARYTLRTCKCAQCLCQYQLRIYDSVLLYTFISTLYTRTLLSYTYIHTHQFSSTSFRHLSSMSNKNITPTINCFDCFAKIYILFIYYFHLSLISFQF